MRAKELLRKQKNHLEIKWRFRQSGMNLLNDFDANSGENANIATIQEAMLEETSANETTFQESFEKLKKLKQA